MRRTPSTGAVLLAAMLAVAGCSSLGGSTAESTLTPVAVPADDPGPADVRFVPGLSADGVADPYDLTDAHATALHNTSYTRRWERTERYANGTVRARSVGVTRAEPEGRRFHVSLAVTGTTVFFFPEAERVSVWANETDVAWIATGENRTVAGADNRISHGVPSTIFMLFLPREMPLDDPAEGTEHRVAPGPPRTLMIVLSAVETRVAGRLDGDGIPRYCVESTGLVAPARFASAQRVTEVEDVSVTVLVGPDGVVHAYHLSYTAIDQGETVEVRHWVRYTNVGDTTATRPSWVGNSTPTAGTTPAHAPRSLEATPPGDRDPPPAECPE